VEQLKWAVVVVITLLIGMLLLHPNKGDSDIAIQTADPTEAHSVAQLEECGYVQHEIFLGDPTMPVLFVVEEAHANLAAQFEVAQIIEGLSRTGLEFLVLVEGSPPTVLELGELMDLADPAVVNVTAAAWFEEGWLSGVELAALSSGGRLQVMGLEPPTSPERVAHQEALDRADFYKLIVSHLTSLLKFSWKVQSSVLREIADAWDAVEGAERALYESGQRGERFSSLSEAIVTAVAEGVEPYQILAPLRNAVTPGGVNHSQLFDAYESAEISYFNAVIEAAFREEVSLATGARELWTQLFTALYKDLEIPSEYRSFETDLRVLKTLTEVWAQYKRDELEARNRRDEAMVERLLEELSSRGYRTGLMVVGAGHTANLKRVLEEQGISYVIITPRSLGAPTPWREVEWNDRLLASEDSAQSPWPWFLEDIFKPEMLLYLPEGRGAFATALSLSDSLRKALAGGQPVSAGAIQRSAVSTVGNSVSVEYVSESGRVLEITLPQDFPLTDTAFTQLNKHLLEIGNAAEYLQRFPAVHVYLEPDGRSGGAFITWTTQERMHVTCVRFDLSDHSMEELLEPFQVGAFDVSFVREHPEALLDARVILDPITCALNAALEELGVAPEEVVRVAIRTGSQELRELPWDTLTILAREMGIEGYERPLLFVKSALADDYEHIRGEDKEQVLAITLRHIASWLPPANHLVVMTIPGSEEEWAMGNPFAQYLINDEGWTWEQYQKEELPYIEQFVETVRSSGGEVIEPNTLGEFIEGLRSSLEGVEHGVVTITLVSHRVNDAAEPMIHFKGTESAVPVSTVVEAIQVLKLAASVDLRFNFIVCQGQEAAPLLVSELDSPAVLTSSRSLGVSTSMVFMSKLFSELQSGLAWWEAYYRAKEWFIDAVLNSSPEDLSRRGIRNFEVPELHSVRELSGVC